MAPSGFLVTARVLAAMASRVPVRGREWLAYRMFARHRPNGDWWNLPMGPRLELRLPASSLQAWMLAFTRGYDGDQVALLASHLEPGTVGLDIGASLGLYTMQLAQRAREVGARVVAVEPVPANVDIIRENLVLNNLDGHASVVQLALGRDRGSLAMLVEDGGAGNATVTTGVRAEELARHAVQGGLGPEVTIRVEPLDSLSFPGRVVVVKIDVEGFEMDVLAGAEQFVARHRPVIFSEFSEEWMVSRGKRPEEPFEWAEQHGYSVSKVVLRRSSGILKRTHLEVTPILSPDERGGCELLLLP